MLKQRHTSVLDRTRHPVHSLWLLVTLSDVVRITHYRKLKTSFFPLWILSGKPHLEALHPKTLMNLQLAVALLNRRESRLQQ
jgi:hypothetical protein